MRKFIIAIVLSVIAFASANADHWFESGLFRYRIISHIGSGGTVEITGFNHSVDVNKIEELNIPAEVPTYSFIIVGIADNAFSYTRNLKSVILPNTITKIGNHPFSSCFQLKSIILSPKIKTIGELAFAGCSELESIVLPNSVTTIGAAAFQNCTLLSQITLPNNLTEISASLFNGCECLTDIVLPDKITYIGDYAFNGCKSLSGISLPNELIFIDAFAFQDCRNIVSVEIPDAVLHIGSNPFKNCSSLESINVGKNNASYHSYDGALYQDASAPILKSCPGAKKNLKIEETTETLDSSCFSGCENLEEIIIPHSVRDIYSNAFDGCYSLKKVQCEIENEFYCGADFPNYDATLLVPKGMVDYYSETEPWCNFKYIKDIEYSSIDDILCDERQDFQITDGRIVFLRELSVEIFDAGGRLIYKGNSFNIPELRKGVYIIKTANQITKAIIN